MYNQNTRRRGKPAVMMISTVIMLIMATLPVSLPAFAEWSHYNKINSLEYKQKYGHWDVLDIPEEFKQNTIHAAALPTGKILLVAGSGNNQQAFDKYSDEGQIEVLKSAIFDPETNKIKTIDTPEDLFCSGHAMLHSGDLLIAGGTSGYEKLEGTVTKPAGAMNIYNEDPSSRVKTFKQGTRFVSQDTGKVYVSLGEFKLKPARKMDHGNGSVVIHRTEARVFVEAIEEGDSYITNNYGKFRLEGLKGSDKNNIYGQGGPMTLDKQDYRGSDSSYEFDPVSEKYVKVGDLNEGRWYPSLPVLNNGDVLAVSGLDNTGQLTDTTERYDPKSKEWEWGPERQLPTYPALFRTKDPNVLFFSGSSSGYGPDDENRDPGFWNVKTNSFKAVNGLRDKNIIETSASVVLPPAKGSNDGSQSRKIIVAGGGGVGESPLVTNRVDIIDLASSNPGFSKGTNLPVPLRYVNLTVTPWDELFMNGGSRDYRAKGNSFSFKSFSFNPTTMKYQPMADELVGRNYHSGSLLLRDGRILVFGGDPLYGDKNNLTAGEFERRIEVYTPPQFFRNDRPVLHGEDNQRVSRGQTVSFHSPDADDVSYARLIPPSSTTHVTNIEQRSVGAIVKTDKNGMVHVNIPKDGQILPNGWYMLFVVNKHHTPSEAVMVHIIN